MPVKSFLSTATVVHFHVVSAFQRPPAQAWIRRRHSSVLARPPSSPRVPLFSGVDAEPPPRTAPSPSIKGVIFDMDGTLVRHAIDFADLRRRVYAVADADPVGRRLERDCVLALAERLSPDGTARCRSIFADVERRALADMEPMAGGPDLVRFLRERGVRRAVLTRNVAASAARMADLYRRDGPGDDGDGDDGAAPPFAPIVARDTRTGPHGGAPLRSKPHPDGILHVCDVWGCRPEEVIMVGDSANDDVAAANRAGCGGAVLLTQPGGARLDTDSGYSVGDSEEERQERTPSLEVESLMELKTHLEAVLDRSKGSDFTT